MFDNTNLTCFEKCVGFPLASEVARLQAQLFTKSGGVTVGLTNKIIKVYPRIDWVYIWISFKFWIKHY